MTLHQLKVFVTVAKIGNFTQAGEKLRVSQPSVTFVVQSLSRELEVKLFEKLGNKVHLTVAGEKLLQHAGEILAKVEGIKEEIDEIKGLKKGKIVVGGSSIAMASLLPVAVQRFKEKYPGVEVALKIERSDILEKKLLEGELHLAIMSWFPRSPLLAAGLYREEEVVVIASPRHPLTKKRSVPLRLLAKEPSIVSEKGSPVRDMVERRFTEAGLPFTPLLEVNLQLGSRDAIKSAVASGLGLGFTTKPYVVSDVKAGCLKLLKVPELKVKRSMYLVVRKSRESSPLVEALKDFLRRYKNL